MLAVDLNCDVGEGAGHDEALMACITSANVACGAHAGNLSTMRETVRLAEAAGVKVGAHPGFADREHFGRRELAMSPEAIFELVRSQVDALRAMAVLHHVKPHGGLYNLAARDRSVAQAIAAAVKACDPALRLYGLAGSFSLSEGKAVGLQVVSEVFADRTYQENGSLTPRSEPGALVGSREDALQQALGFVREHQVRATTGKVISLRAETICLHGDGKDAVSFALHLSAGLRAAGVNLTAS